MFGHHISGLRPLEGRPEMSAMNEVNNRLRRLEEGHQLLHESVTRQSELHVFFFRYAGCSRKYPTAIASVLFERVC